MFGVNAPTKTEDTIRQYTRDVKSIANNVSSLEEIPNYFMNNSNIWAKATFRKYRAGILCYLGLKLMRKEEANQPSNHIVKVIDELKRIPSNLYNKKGAAGASFRKKSITIEERLKLIAELNKLEKSGCKWASLGASMFELNIYLGLRPCEFWKVEKNKILHDGEGSFLEIRNAKTTNGRSHGETRKIRLDDSLSAADINFINSVFANIQEVQDKGEEKRAKRAIPDVIRVAFRKAWPRRSRRIISLYSARHQFAANIKKKLGYKNCAALMGQRSNLTCQVHYGKRTKGTVGMRKDGSIIVSADKNDLARVVIYDVGIDRFLEKNKKRDRPLEQSSFAGMRM